MGRDADVGNITKVCTMIPGDPPSTAPDTAPHDTTADVFTGVGIVSAHHGVECDHSKATTKPIPVKDEPDCCKKRRQAVDNASSPPACMVKADDEPSIVHFYDHTLHIESEGGFDDLPSTHGSGCKEQDKQQMGDQIKEDIMTTPRQAPRTINNDEPPIVTFYMLCMGSEGDFDDLSFIDDGHPTSRTSTLSTAEHESKSDHPSSTPDIDLDEFHCHALDNGERAISGLIDTNQAKLQPNHSSMTCPSPTLCEGLLTQAPSLKSEMWYKYKNKPCDIPFVTWLPRGPR